MQPSTFKEYISIAQHFENSNFSSPPTSAQLQQKLLETAPNFRPAYWRRLKRGVSLKLAEEGDDSGSKQVSKLSNPTTVGSQNNQKKKKQKRIKFVKQSDHQTLTQYLIENEDLPCLAAVVIAYTTGCRPAEMNDITLLGDDQLYIRGAKKIGDIRGCDRVITLTSRAYEALELLLPHLKHDLAYRTTDMNRIQRRLQRHTKKLWPRRKSHISLYSYRHTVGGLLKSSGIPSKEIAKFMGHRSTDSISVYGDPRSSLSDKMQLQIISSASCKTHHFT